MQRFPVGEWFAPDCVIQRAVRSNRGGYQRRSIAEGPGPVSSFSAALLLAVQQLVRPGGPPSSSYFEGHCCPLARYGHSRDERRGNPQIVPRNPCERAQRRHTIEGSKSDRVCAVISRRKSNDQPLPVSDTYADQTFQGPLG